MSRPLGIIAEVYLVRQQLHNTLGVAAREAFRMNGLAAFALYDHIAEKQMLADAHTAYPFTHDNRFVIADEFAFVIGYFVIINRQFVR